MNEPARRGRPRKAATVPSPEYVEPVVEETAGDTPEVVAEPATEEPEETPAETKATTETKKKNVASNDAWEIGKPAPFSVYYDHERNVLVSTQPVRARGVIAKGEPVSQRVYDRIKNGEIK